LSADDWEREQETLYVLQNNDLMKQIKASIDTHKKNKGYKPTPGEINEITDI
jgi:antitoxin YefM